LAEVVVLELRTFEQVRERLDPMKQKNIGSFFASKEKPVDMAMDMEGLSLSHTLPHPLSLSTQINHKI